MPATTEHKFNHMDYTDDWGVPARMRQTMRDQYWRRIIIGSLIGVTVLVVVAVAVYLGLHFGLAEKTLPSPIYLSQQYSAVDSFEGSTFLNNFGFWVAPDPTNGFVDYVSAAEAAQQNLTSMNGNKLVIKAGSSATKAGIPSVRIQSRREYTQGLFLADIEHMPSFCGAWPAFWTCDTDHWPDNGEIDILEGINDWTHNQMALHTSDGCNMHKVDRNQTGTVVTTTCRSRPGKKDYGCAVNDTSLTGTSSYGKKFNDNQGGMYATDWRPNGIRIWFFPRNALPSDLAAMSRGSNQAPSMTTWGKPVAEFPNGRCDINSHFKKHRIIFDLTFCGDFAGDWWKKTSCYQKDKYETCESYLLDNPPDLANAYWTINSVKVFQYSGDGAIASY